MGTVANLSVKIGVNNHGFQQGLDGMAGQVSGFTSRLSGIGVALAGAFSINAITGAAGQAVEAASRIADMAERVGFSAEAVQRLEFAATQSGSTFDSVATSIRVMSDRITDGKLPTALTAMGVSLASLQGMTPDQAFVTIADAIARIPDPMLQSATAVDIFGRGAQSIMPAIKAGFTEIGEAAPLMANQTVEALDTTGDKWQEMGLKINAMRAEALTPLLEQFKELPASMQVGIAGISMFLPSLEGIGIAILAAGGPKAALALLMEGFVAFGAFFTSTLPGLFAAGITFLTTTLPAAFGAVIAFLGPQGLIALGIIALGLIWVTWGDEITTVVTGVYNAIKTWLVDKWAGIATSMTTALAGVGTVFHDLKNKVVTYAQQLFEGVKTWLLDRFSAIIGGIKAKVDAVTGYFRDMYEAVVGHSYVPDMISGIASAFGSLGSSMVGPAASATGLVTQAFSTMASAVKGVIQNLIGDLSGKLSGWMDGFMPSWAAKIGGGLANSAMNAGMSTLAKHAGGGMLSSLLGGGTAAAGGIGAGAAGGAAGGGAGGAALGLGGIGMGTALMATGGIAGAAVLAWAIAKKGLFRGGEESLKVNPARDEFLSQFGAGGTGEGSGFANLAAKLSSLTGEAGGGSLFKALTTADTMKGFSAAVAGIEGKLKQLGDPTLQNKLTAIQGNLDRAIEAGASPEVISALRTQLETQKQASAAQDQLTAGTNLGTLAVGTLGLSADTASLALNNLALVASAVQPSLMGRGSGMPTAGVDGEFLGSLEDDMQSGDGGVTINAGTIIGNPDELAEMVTNAWEGGGQPFNRFRILSAQAAT